MDHGVFDQRLQYDLDDLALPGAFIQLPLHPDPVVKAHVLDVHIQLNVPDLIRQGDDLPSAAEGGPVKLSKGADHAADLRHVPGDGGAVDEIQ